MSEISKRIANLSPEKQALLAKRLNEKKKQVRNNTFPLSFAQQRLWFLDQLEPGNSFYNIPAALRLNGTLDLQALELTLTEIVRRHEVLRTNFDMVQGQAQQIIRPDGNFSLPVIDLSDLPPQQRQQQAQQLAQQEANTPFDLRHDSLIRAQVVRLEQNEHIILVTMHHIISDGWSMSILINEVSQLYGAFSQGKDSPLPELVIQYADYALWQRQYLQGEVLDEQLNYWRQQLSGAPPLLELPTDFARPALQSYRGATHRFELSESLTNELKQLSQEHGTTLFMTLLAAFKVLLYRYSGQSDISVGTPIAGRNRRETEPLIGFFVNTLVLRSQIDARASFVELLQQEREVALGGYAHQDLPFEKLVEVLQPQRDLSRSPLFQVMMVLQNAPTQSLQLPGLRLSPVLVSGDGGVAKFDLTLSWTDDDLISGLFEYNTDLFEASSIQQLSLHLEHLVGEMLEQPQVPVSRLSLLDEEQQQRLLVDWNQTTRAYEGETSIAQLFEQQVERTPEHSALQMGQEQMSYAELNRRANQLANYLRGQGVGLEDLVGICMERSPEMVVALLAILKTGAAYVPLDPSYPQERLVYMLEDAEVKLLLTQKHLVKVVGDGSRNVICLDSDWEEIASHSTTNVQSPARGENLSYVIYTSGSTGQPKGVAIEHHSAVTLILWAREVFGVSDLAGVLASTSICFDLSVFELFVPLSMGGKVILVENALQLSQLSAREEITLINTVPSVMESLLNAEMLPQGLRVVNLAGESLQNRLVQRIYEQGIVEKVFNLYGPSEDTTYSTYAEISRGSEQEPAIGKPIANTEVYVLNTDFQLLPVGIFGELYIGGAGLARGYLKRGDQTAERFVPHPFSQEAGARLYRTGDKVRWRNDGNLEFAGRLDHQVKLRGFRIELGEIESVLESFGGITRAIVIAREDEPGLQRLVAYLAGEPTVNINELRTYLQTKLPAYMLPSAYVLLEKLPLTNNGKVNRRALPAPEADISNSQEGFVAPRDVWEFRLVNIWEDILGVRPISIRDNFFALGGHSLLAVRLMVQIQLSLGKRLPLATLFQMATVEQLANILRADDKSDVWSTLVEIQAGGSKRPVFFVHPAGGNVFCYLPLARYLGPDQPFYGLQANTFNQEKPTDSDVEGMASQYIKAMRAAQPEGPYFLGGWSVGGVIAFEMARQLQEDHKQGVLLLLIDAYAPNAVNHEVPADENDLTLLANFALDMGIPLSSLTPSKDFFQKLGMNERLAYLLKAAKNANLLPSDTDIAHILGLFNVFNSNVKAVRNYIPQKIQSQIILLKASEHLSETAEDPTLGWDQFTETGVQVHEIPGNHFTLIREPGVQVIADQLKVYLDEAATTE